MAGGGHFVEEAKTKSMPIWLGWRIEMGAAGTEIETAIAPEGSPQDRLSCVPNTEPVGGQSLSAFLAVRL